MSVELWMEGAIVEFKNNEPCKRAIIRRVDKKEILLANIADGAVLTLDRDVIEGMYDDGCIKFLAESRDLGDLKFFDLKEWEQRETNRKYRYIRRLQEKDISIITEKSSSSAIKELAGELGENPPHWQSVRNWRQKFVKAGNKMRGLYPKHRFKGPRQPKIDDQVLEIIRKESKRYYKLSQPTIASVRRNVEDKILAHNLDNPDRPLRAPTYLTIQSRIMERTYKNKQKPRQGSRSFQAELANAQSGFETARILERVEIDHTMLDINVLHDDHKTLLGRPFITVLIDHYSHMVLGFQLSFENPSFASVCMACMNAFLPKESFLESVGCDSPWPAHGVPSTLVTDNGNEFWGKHFISVADEIGLILQYCPIRKGNYKSRVERFFGIVNSWVLDDLPGVVRKPGKSGEGYDARQEATMTFSEFKGYFVNWLTGIFHNLPLQENGMTPNEMWLASEVDFPISIEEETELTPILLATEYRELGKGGIRIFNMNYNSSILKDIYGRIGPCKVTVKFNPFDIGYILMLDAESKLYIKLYCDDYAYACGLSVFEHRKVTGEIKKICKSKLGSLELQKARVKLSKERDDAHAKNARRKTQTTTKNAARSEKIGVSDIRLVVDNSKKIIQAGCEIEDEELNLEGWSVD